MKKQTKNMVKLVILTVFMAIVAAAFYIQRITISHGENRSISSAGFGEATKIFRELIATKETKNKYGNTALNINIKSIKTDAIILCDINGLVEITADSLIVNLMDSKCIFIHGSQHGHGYAYIVWPDIERLYPVKKENN
jgi:hypothetical protein